jgi:hypothetical protein
MSREAPRGAGSCAISSGGKSKSKAETWVMKTSALRI